MAISRFQLINRNALGASRKTLVLLVLHWCYRTGKVGLRSWTIDK